MIGKFVITIYSCMAFALVISKAVDKISYQTIYDNRIAGAHLVSIEEYPWQVELEITKGIDTFICGGSIIGKNLILTAAHCL